MGADTDDQNHVILNEFHSMQSSDSCKLPSRHVNFDQHWWQMWQLGGSPTHQPSIEDRTAAQGVQPKTLRADLGAEDRGKVAGLHQQGTVDRTRVSEIRKYNPISDTLVRTTTSTRFLHFAQEGEVTLPRRKSCLLSSWIQRRVLRRRRT